MPHVPRLPADAAIALCRGVGVGGACGTPPGSPVGGSPPGSPSAARGGASGGGPGQSRSRSPIRRPLLSGPGGALLRASGIASQEDLAYWWSPEAEVRVWAASHAESHVEEIVGDLGAMQEYLGPDAHVNEEAAELQTLKDRAVGLSDAAGIDVRNLNRRRK